MHNSFKADSTKPGVMLYILAIECTNDDESNPISYSSNRIQGITNANHVYSIPSLEQAAKCAQ